MNKSVLVKKNGSKFPACFFRAAFVRFCRHPWRLFLAIARHSLRMRVHRLGVCRTYASRLDFCPFPLLLRCQNTHVAQLRSVFVALHQEKIIKNRLEVLKSDRLLAYPLLCCRILTQSSYALILPACRQTGRLVSGRNHLEVLKSDRLPGA